MWWGLSGCECTRLSDSAKRTSPLGILARGSVSVRAWFRCLRSRMGLRPPSFLDEEVSACRSPTHSEPGGNRFYGSFYQQNSSHRCAGRVCPYSEPRVETTPPNRGGLRANGVCNLILLSQKPSLTLQEWPAGLGSCGEGLNRFEQQVT